MKVIREGTPTQFEKYVRAWRDGDWECNRCGCIVEFEGEDRVMPMPNYYYLKQAEAQCPTCKAFRIFTKVDQ